MNKVKRFVLVVIEFIKLKLDETKVFWIIVGGVLVFLYTPVAVHRTAVVLPWFNSWVPALADKCMRDGWPQVIAVWTIGLLVVLFVVVVVLVLLIFIQSIVPMIPGAIKALVKWLQQNWKQANANVDRRSRRGGKHA